MKSSAYNWSCLLALSLLATGCATNGRFILLKEYGATCPSSTNQPLQGTTICIKTFHCSTNLVSPDPTNAATEVPQFKLVEYTPEQEKAWDREWTDLKKQTSKADSRDIGFLRNMFGMVMSHVYALNDPAAWMAESLKMDLERQGAKVVDATQADSADLCLSGTVQFCRVDIYMKIWADVIVDLEVQPKGGDSSHKLLHTSGGKVAWVGSTGEFYQPLRECRQKISILATDEILKTLKRPPLVTVKEN